jgi:hypothetical protein
MRDLPELGQGGGRAVDPQALLRIPEAIPIGRQTLPESFAQLGEFRVQRGGLITHDGRVSFPAEGTNEKRPLPGRTG